MPPTPKQLEIRQREERIISVARLMLRESGYHGLSMDRIAESLDYSKGTIYNHFSCKEEIVIALAIETMEKRVSLFDLAVSYPGSPRERILAVSVACERFAKHYPDHFHVETIIRNASVLAKTSEKRRMLMRSCEQRCMGMVAGIVRDAVAQGDLEMSPHLTPEELVFGLWALSFGAYSIAATSDSLAEVGVRDPYLTVRVHLSALLDSYGWLPLNGGLDDSDRREKIEREVFGDG